MTSELIDGVQDICERTRCGEPELAEWSANGILWIQHGQFFFHWKVGSGSHREAKNLRKAIIDWLENDAHGGMLGYIGRFLASEDAA